MRIMACNNSGGNVDKSKKNLFPNKEEILFCEELPSKFLTVMIH
jgi:hypothetical protein